MPPLRLLVPLVALVLAAGVVVKAGKPVLPTGPSFNKWVESHGCVLNATQRAAWERLAASHNGTGGGRCSEGSRGVLGEWVVCESRRASLEDGYGGTRDVYFQTPSVGAGPFPVALFFQGSFFDASLTFSGAADLPFGALYQAQLVRNLLDAGYAVVAPAAMFNGATFWSTNLPPWDTIIPLGLWPTSPDYLLLERLFDAMEKGAYGPLDMGQLHGLGISSGAYMASRMGFDYHARFKSLVIESGSYYYCGGPLCADPLPVGPGALPSDHPPTLFLHGLLDPIVPIWTMELYLARAHFAGVNATSVVDPVGMHQWIPRAPRVALEWVQAHTK